MRTTITLPSDLYEKLREQAFYQRETISSLVRKSVNKNIEGGKRLKKSLKTDFVGKFSVGKQKTGLSKGIRALLGLSKFVKGKKNFVFDRKKFYDDALKHKMSFGF